MALFAVSYQLNNRKDYEPLWQELARLGAHKAMRDFYLLDLDLTAYRLRVHLAAYVDDDDMIFVVPFIEKPSYSRAFKGTNDWVEAQF